MSTVFTPNATKLYQDATNYLQIGDALCDLKSTINAHEMKVHMEDQLINIQHDGFPILEVLPASVKLYQDLNANSKKISGLAAGTSNGDALIYEQVIGEYLPTSTKLNGLVDPDGALDLNSQQIQNLADPSLAQDAATKAYVDSAISTIVPNPTPQYSQLIMTSQYQPTVDSQIVKFTAVNMNNGNQISYDDASGVITIDTAGRYRFLVDLKCTFTQKTGEIPVLQLYSDPLSASGAPETQNQAVQYASFDIPQASNALALKEYVKSEIILDVLANTSYALRITELTDSPYFEIGSRFTIEKLA